MSTYTNTLLVQNQSAPYGPISLVSGDSVVLNLTNMTMNPSGTYSVTGAQSQTAGTYTYNVAGSNYAVTASALNLTSNAASAWNMAGGALTLSVKDNTANAFALKEGANSYFDITTTNAAETVIFGNSTTNPSFSFAGSGTVTIAGDLTVNGTTTTINSSVLLVADNLVVANSGPSTSRDAGYMVQRFQAANDLGTGDVVSDTAALSIADIGDQTGMTSTQIKLAGASAVDDFYNGWWIKVTSGSSQDQVRKITDYVGATKVATLATAWTDQNPADNDAVSLYNRPFMGAFYIELTDEWVFGSTASDPGTSVVGVTDLIKLHVGGLTADDLATFTGGGTLPDSATMVWGTGSDLSIVHDGTNSVVTNVTGNLLFDLAHAGNGNYINAQLGVDDGTQAFRVLNNTGTAMLHVSSDGTVTINGTKTIKSGSSDLIVTGGNGGGTLSLRSNGGGAADGIDITNASNIVVYKALIPDSDSARTLGSSSKAWSTAFVDTLTSLDANDRVKLGTDAQVVLALPQFTDANRNSNITAVAGDFQYNTDTDAPQFYNGAAWVTVASSGDTGDLNDAYGNGSFINVNAGAVSLIQGNLNETTGTLSITYIADDFTGTPNAINIDFSGADSFDNAGDFYGVKLVGAANVGAGNSVGIRVASFDVGIENASSLAQSGASVFTGNVSQTTGTYTYNVAASAFAVDAASFSIDSTSASNLSVTAANLSVQTLTSGTLAVSSAGALNLTSVAGDWQASGNVTIDSSAGSITIGGDGNSGAMGFGTGGGNRAITVGNASGSTSVTINAGTGNIDIGTGAQARTVNLATGAAAQVVSVGSTNGASSLTLQSGSGNMVVNPNGNMVAFAGTSAGRNYSYIVGFTANAAENVAAGDVLYLTSSATVGLSDANAAGKKFVVGIAAETKTTGNATRVASIPGQVVAVNTDLSAATVGVAVYVDTATAGGLVVVPTLTTGCTVFQVGYVHTADVAGTAKIIYMPQYITAIA